jgi:hypothetical protein
MGKFDKLTELKKTRARGVHACSKCGASISAGDDYYNESIRDRFLHSLRAKKFCVDCVEKHGDALLKKIS